MLSRLNSVLVKEPGPIRRRLPDGLDGVCSRHPISLLGFALVPRGTSMVVYLFLPLSALEPAGTNTHRGSTVT